jgi:hypothetical protein
MHKVIIAVMLAAFSASALALAQPVPPRAATSVMTAAELKAALFGVHLYGVAGEGAGMRWDECIEPDGDTLYTTPTGEMHGRLTIAARGLACFAYDDDDFRTAECFTMRRNKDGFVFSGEFGGSDFVVTKVVRGIRTCEKQDLIG